MSIMPQSIRAYRHDAVRPAPPMLVRPDVPPRSELRRQMYGLTRMTACLTAGLDRARV